MACSDDTCVVFFFAEAISYTLTDSTYQYLDFRANETTHFVFKIQGLVGAQVGLFAEKKASLSGVSFYEFVVGSSSATHPTLRLSESGSTVASSSVSYPNKVYNETAFGTFWISWKDHQMALGFGLEPGKSPIFTYDASASPMAVNYIGFQSYKSYSHTFVYNTGKYFGC